MLKLCFFTMLLFVFCCCKNNGKPNQQQQVLAIKNLGSLATVEYHLSKVVKANDNKTWFKIGDRKILMTCEATVKAGINLSNLNNGDVSIKGDDITLNLPKATIISFNMPFENIKVAYQAKGIFRKEFDAKEKADLLTQGEMQLKEQIDALNILKDAEKNAQLFLTNFLNQAGYNKVTINFGSLNNNNLN